MMYGEVLGSAKCTANASCKSWARILALMLLPVGITALTVAYIALAGAAPDPESAALASILFVLFQSEAVIRANDESGASLFSSLAVLEIAIPGVNLCLWPGLSARMKTSLPLFLNAVAIATLGAVYLAHKALFVLGKTYVPPLPARYRRALVALLLAGYGAIADVCMKLLAWVEVDEVPYQALTGDRWMQTSDQWFAAVWLVLSVVPMPFWTVYGLALLRDGSLTDVFYGWGIVFPLPAWVVSLWYRRAQRTEADRSAAHTMWKNRTSPFRPQFWYWDGVLLAQRLSFNLLSLMFSFNILLRAFMMAVFSAAFYFTHVHTKAFCSSRTNRVQSLAMAGLATICATTMASAYTLEHGHEVTSDIRHLHTAVSWGLGVVPLAALWIIAHPTRGRRHVAKRAFGKGNTKSAAASEMQRPLLAMASAQWTTLHLERM